FTSRRRHTRFSRDWSSDVCSSDLSPGLYSPGSRRSRLVAGVDQGKASCSGITSCNRSYIEVETLDPEKRSPSPVERDPKQSKPNSILRLRPSREGAGSDRIA